MIPRSLLAARRGVCPLAALAFIVTACQSPQDSLSPSLAVSQPSKAITVVGQGTGGGVVTAPAYGETPELNCVITNGTVGPEDCSRRYSYKTVVTLTVVPDPGSTFTGWGGSCSGFGTALTCTVTMNVNRTVKAKFAGTSTPKYTLNVTGSGTGSGTIASQTGLSPAVNCVITAGTAVSGTCSAKYTQGTAVTLTATPAGGQTFDGWGGNCSGTGTCALTMSTNRAAAAAFTAPAGLEAAVGRWDAPQFNPIIGIHLVQLMTGKFLLWGHGGEPQVWDPVGGFTEVADAACTDPQICELFCAGQAFLPDGSVLVAGGHNEALGNNYGLLQSSIFDGFSWRATGSMTYGRWYPTLVTMSDGQVVAISGDQAPGVNAMIPERYSGGVWTPLTTASRNLRLYPRAFVEPKNGRIFIAGDHNPSLYLNPLGTGGWSAGPTRLESERSYGSAVMLDDKVIYFGGGGEGSCPGNLPRRTGEWVDLAAATPLWKAIAPMTIGRRQLNATILADGTVLITGGTSACGFNNEAGAVFAAERWNPSGGTDGQGAWTTMANASVVRAYHSTTALMPDGRVLSTGSGSGGGATNQNSYEIYSPPYLYQGPRPSYGLASNVVHYNSTFTITTTAAASITKVHLIRLAATTHAFDQGQRLRRLVFQVAADGQSLRATAPLSGKIAPPGPYMLFVVNAAGVPSVGQIVRVGQ
jgi:hypothetical protein